MTGPFALPGLTPPRGRTPAARLDALLGESDGALAARLEELATAHRAVANVDLRRLAVTSGLPFGEVVASPFATRMVAMGVGVGATTVLAELRAERPARIAGRTRDAAHGRHERGYRVAGKYEQFGIETPFAIYRAQHPSKWGPHELLHQAIGFFHREGASRFARYLGARLNELLPVVTFFGHEQAMRLDEGAFDRVGAGLRPGAEARRALHRVAKGRALDALAARAAPVFRPGLEHFRRELACIDAELRSGVRTASPHPFLDTSSDALAYVVATEAAQTDARWLAALATGDGITDLAAYREHVEACHDALLFGTLTVDEVAHRNARARRHRFDLRLRAATLPRALGGRAEAWLDAQSSLAQGECPPELSAWFANGLDDAPAGLHLASLAESLAATCPTLARFVDLDELAEPLATSGALLRRASLPARAANALPAGLLRDAARLDACVARRSVDDPSRELSESGAGRLRPRRSSSTAQERIVASAAFEPLVVDHDVLGHGRAVEGLLLVGSVDGSPTVAPVPRAFGPVFRRLVSGASREAAIERTRAALGTSRARAAATLDTLAKAGILHVVRVS